MEGGIFLFCLGQSYVTSGHDFTLLLTLDPVLCVCLFVCVLELDVTFFEWVKKALKCFLKRL